MLHGNEGKEKCVCVFVCECGVDQAFQIQFCSASSRQMGNKNQFIPHTNNFSWEQQQNLLARRSPAHSKPPASKTRVQQISSFLGELFKMWYKDQTWYKYSWGVTVLKK